MFLRNLGAPATKKRNAGRRTKKNDPRGLKKRKGQQELRKKKGRGGAYHSVFGKGRARRKGRGKMVPLTEEKNRIFSRSPTSKRIFLVEKSWERNSWISPLKEKWEE